MTKNYEANPPYVKADPEKVLCDGFSTTGLGGRVTNKNTAVLDTWQEMTAAEAEALIKANATEYESEVEEKAAAYDIIMG